MKRPVEDSAESTVQQKETIHFTVESNMQGSAPVVAVIAQRIPIAIFSCLVILSGLVQVSFGCDVRVVL